MKIESANARSYLRHLDALERLTGRSDTVAVYRRCRRLEAHLNRLAVALCNGDINQETWGTAGQKPLKELSDLFKGFIVHINGDPRGYTIKVSIPAGKLLENTPTDWGGDFCPGQEF